MVKLKIRIQPEETSLGYDWENKKILITISEKDPRLLETLIFEAYEDHYKGKYCDEWIKSLKNNNKIKSIVKRFAKGKVSQRQLHKLTEDYMNDETRAKMFEYIKTNLKNANMFLTKIYFAVREKVLKNNNRFNIKKYKERRKENAINNQPKVQKSNTAA